MRLIPFLLAALLVMGMSGGLWAATSCCDIGEVTPPLKVFDVTGPYKGEATCYVCAYKGAPTVQVFFKDTGEETASLLVALNEFVQQKGQEDLKAVAIFMSGPNSKPWLEKLAQEKGIKFPLVVLPLGQTDPGIALYHLNPNSRNTFLVSLHKAILANLSNVDVQSFRQVAEASSKMLEER